MITNLEKPVQKGIFCFLANLRLYLSYYNVSCEESWIGGIIGYLGFYFTSKKLDTNAVVSGRNQTFEEMFESFQNKLSKPLKKSKFLSSNECMEFLEKLLDDRIPAMVWIDEYYLESSIYYNIAHFWSLAVVTDISKNQVTLYDNEIITIDKTIFCKATRKYGIIEMYYQYEKEIFWRGSQTKVLALGLKKVIENMNASRPLYEEYVGLYGIKCFVNVLKSCSDQEVIYNYFYQINRGSGLPLTRQSMYYFINELGKKYASLDVSKCKDIYDTLSDCWRKITNLLYKLSVVMDEDLKLRIINRIEEVVKLEKKGVEALEDLVEQLENIIVKEDKGGAQCLR